MENDPGEIENKGYLDEKMAKKSIGNKLPCRSSIHLGPETSVKSIAKRIGNGNTVHAQGITRNFKTAYHNKASLRTAVSMSSGKY